MAAVEQDDGPGGKHSDFEKAAARILAKDLVVKKRLSQNKRPAAESGNDNPPKPPPKHCIGKSGVQLRFHKPLEYHKRNKAQKDELYEWRSKNKGNGGNGEKRPKHLWWQQLVMK